MSKVNNDVRTPIKEGGGVQTPNVATLINNNTAGGQQQHSITIPESNNRPHVHKGLKLFQAIAINVMNMFGTGPFITLPILLATMNGPQVSY